MGRSGRFECISVIVVICNAVYLQEVINGRRLGDCMSEVELASVEIVGLYCLSCLGCSHEYEGLPK
jgi:hypothetical protein